MIRISAALFIISLMITACGSTPFGFIGDVFGDRDDEGGADLGDIPTIDSITNTTLTLYGQALPGVVSFDGTASEDVTWTLRTTYESTFSEFTPHSDLYVYKTAAEGTRDTTTSDLVSSVTDFEIYLGDRMYHTDLVTAEVSIRDSDGNTATETIYDAAIDMPIGDVPTWDHDNYGLAAHQSGGPTYPNTGTIAEWSKVEIIIHGWDAMMGDDTWEPAGYDRWLHQVRAEPGSRNVAFIGHAGEHCINNPDSPTNYHKYQWATALLDSLRNVPGGGSADTNMFIHKPSGDMAYLWQGNHLHDSLIVNLTNDFGRRRFAQLLANMWNHSDNRAPYTGYHFDNWGPWWGYETWNDDFTDEVNAPYGYDQNLNTTRLGLDIDEQRAKREASIEFLHQIRYWVEVTNSTLIAREYFQLGGNSDYAFGDEEYLAVQDHALMEGFTCGPDLSGPYIFKMYHNSVSDDYEIFNNNGNLLLDNYGEWPTPSGYTASMHDISSALRDSSGGGFVWLENRRTGSSPIRNEVWGQLFDNVYPIFLNTGAWTRHYNHPDNEGLAALELGTPDGVATVDSSHGYWYIEREWDSGDDKILVVLGDPDTYDCETDSLEYLAISDSDTVRWSDGFAVIKTMQFSDNTSLDGIQDLDMTVESPTGEYYFRTRTTVGVSDLSSTCPAEDIQWGSWSSWALRSSDLVDYDPGGSSAPTEVANQWCNIQVQVAAYSGGPATTYECASFKSPK